MNINPFVSRSRNLPFFCTGFYGKTVISKLNTIDTAETAPKQPVPPVIFNIERVN